MPSDSNIEDTLDIDIEITPSTSSTEMFSQWNSGQDEQLDIAVPNNNLVPWFMDADLVAPMPEDVVDNFDSLYDKFQQFVDEQFTAGGDSYGVPIRFGWYGYASRVDVFRDHILPLSAPGIVGGSLFVFVPSVGAFVTPRFLAQGKLQMIGILIENRVNSTYSIGYASAASMFVLVSIVLAVVLVFQYVSIEDLGGA